MVIYDKICYRNALEIREKVLVMSIRLRFKHAQMNQTNQTNQSSDNVSTGFAGFWFSRNSDESDESEFRQCVNSICRIKGLTGFWFSRNHENPLIAVINMIFKQILSMEKAEVAKYYRIKQR